MSLVGMPGYQETPAGWIPADWSASHLGAVASVRKDKGVAKQGIPCVELEHVEPETGRLLGWDSSGTQASIKTSFKQGDVLFGKLRPYLRKYAVAPFDGICTTEILAIHPRDGQSDSRFLFHLMQGDGVFATVEALSYGTKMPRVSWSDLSEIVLGIPPLPEQQRIAAILTAVDDKLDVIARQIEATQTLKQGLMQTLFSRGVGTQDADGRWVPHTEFKDSELGEIPVGWEVTTVGAVCEVKGGKRLPKGEVLTDENTGYPYIRVTDMYMGGVNTDGILYVPAHVQPSIARYTISKDDIFISVAGTLGLVGVIPDDLDGANLTENADKLTDIKICRDFLLHCLCADGIQGAIAREGTANAQPKLALTRIREFLLPLPPRPEQERIATILRSVGEKLATLQGKEKRYLALKRGLMQKLLTGEWRVSVDTSATGA